MLSGGISARTARLNGTSSMAIRGDAQILSDESGRRSGAREVAGEARPGQRKSSQASAQRRRAGSLEPSNFRRPPPRGRPVERTGAPTHEQGERSPVAVRKKCLAERNKSGRRGAYRRDNDCAQILSRRPMLLVRRIVAKFASSQAEERGRKVGRCCWLRGQVTPPFAERRQTKRDQSRLAPGDACALMRTESSPTSRPERNQSKRISSAGRLAKASASAARASLRGVTRRPPTAWESTHVAPRAEVLAHCAASLASAAAIWK